MRKSLSNSTREKSNCLTASKLVFGCKIPGNKYLAKAFQTILGVSSFNKLLPLACGGKKRRIDNHNSIPMSMGYDRILILGGKEGEERFFGFQMINHQLKGDFSLDFRQLGMVRNKSPFF